ncbi:MAG: hypothetical protein PHV15_06410 [Thomasclavelia ramosa]|nr:hypothetical protein [Thomasclavelia ramosa]
MKETDKQQYITEQMKEHIDEQIDLLLEEIRFSLKERIQKNINDGVQNPDNFEEKYEIRYFTIENNGIKSINIYVNPSLEKDIEKLDRTRNQLKQISLKKKFLVFDYGNNQM